MTIDRLLKVREVAELFNLAIPRVRQMIRDGELVGIRMGDGANPPYRVSEKCVVQWIEAHQTTPLSNECSPFP